MTSYLNTRGIHTCLQLFTHWQNISNSWSSLPPSLALSRSLSPSVLFNPRRAASRCRAPPAEDDLRASVRDHRTFSGGRQRGRSAQAQICSCQPAWRHRQARHHAPLTAPAHRHPYSSRRDLKKKRRKVCKITLSAPLRLTGLQLQDSALSFWRGFFFSHTHP